MKGTVRVGKIIIGMAVLMMGQASFAQLKLGDNAQMNAGAAATFGYAGDYGNTIQSSHGLDFGFSGALSGFYYNPNFLSFTATPYYNQSRADSDSQSLTGASGIAASTNIFTGSKYPGAVSYHYDANSTGTFGLPGQPDFTTHGTGQGFSIGWSALLPDWPTLSVGYSQGSGSGTLYGTDQTTDSHNRLFNLNSSYMLEGFHLSGFYTHTNFDSTFPEFLTGQGEETNSTNAQDFGFGTNHNLPFHGTFYANYNHETSDTTYNSGSSNDSSYTANNEAAGATFNPTRKLSLFVNETYTDNLSGFLSSGLAGTGGVPPVVNLGSGSHSYTFGGGVGYQITNYLSSNAQAIHYNQFYFGQSYTGTFLSGSLNYAKKLFNMFSFSASVVESANGQGEHATGFIANVNYSHRFGKWQTSGNFSYAQNVQSYLITYTTSYYNYSANVHRRFGHSLQWTGAFNGAHSGLTNDPGSGNQAEAFSTSLGARRLTLTGNYNQSSGTSVLGLGGLQPIAPTPGLENTVFFTGKSYGGGISGTPIRNLVLSAAFNRSFSDTTSNNIFSRNNAEVFNTQLQYHLRRISLQAGYTRFSQGITAVSNVPFNTNSYFVGISRWFDIF